MTHGSLFSGIGGFDLAAEWMGWQNIFHCEIGEFPRKILKHHFPNSICYEDIKKTDFTKHRGEIDIISGGFPCQPYSNAGKRRGKEDDRHLWPEMLRVIREVQPRFVVGENVAGLLSWNNGMVFHEIITDLENEGYETQAFLIPACATNAPHRRDRIWFIAHSNNARTNERMQFNGERKENDEQWRGQSQSEYRENGINGITTDTDNGSGSRNTVQTRRTELEKLHEPPSNAPNTDSKRHTSYGKSKSIEGNWSGNNGEQKERSEQTERINGLDGLSRITAHTDGSRINRKKKYEDGNKNSRDWEQSNNTNNNGKVWRTTPETDGTEQRNNVGENNGKEGEIRWGEEGDVFGELRSNGNVAYTETKRLEGLRGIQERYTKFYRRQTKNNWENFPTQSPVCSGDDGISTELDGITFPKWRNESIKGYGNAVVPQVVYQIFKAIEQSLL